MARRFTSPSSEAVCCDGNNPLPPARDACSLVVLADAFPYIWHKRLLAEEMMRAVGSRGVIVLPHLHSSLGENFSAGMTLTPAGYASLLEPQALSRRLEEEIESELASMTDDTEAGEPREIVDSAGRGRRAELGPHLAVGPSLQPTLDELSRRERRYMPTVALGSSATRSIATSGDSSIGFVKTSRPCSWATRGRWICCSSGC